MQIHHVLTSFISSVTDIALFQSFFPDMQSSTYTSFFITTTFNLFISINLFQLIQRIPVDTLGTDEICKLVEARGFEKRRNEVPPPPGEDEDDNDEVNEFHSRVIEDLPGMENEEDPELEAFKDGRLPAAPGMEEDAYRPAPLSPEEKEEL